MRSIFGIIASVVVAQVACAQILPARAEGNLVASAALLRNVADPATCSQSLQQPWAGWSPAGGDPQTITATCSLPVNRFVQSQAKLGFSRIGPERINIEAEVSKSAISPLAGSTGSRVDGSLWFGVAHGTAWTLQGTVDVFAGARARIAIFHNDVTVFDQTYSHTFPRPMPFSYTSPPDATGIWRIVLQNEAGPGEFDGFARTNLSVQSSGASLTQSWILGDESTLGPKWQHAMVWQSPQSRVVVFGGRDGSGAFTNETLTWDDDAWVPLPAGVSPSARADHAMADAFGLPGCDVVMFGGQTPSGGLLDDTWALQGDTWTEQLLTPRPTPRGGHTMSFDTPRQRVVLFGGFVNTPQGLAYSSETWELLIFNSQLRWRLRTPIASPPARFAHASAYDPLRRRVVIFGGWNSTGPLNDTWEWDGIAWTQLSGTMPPARYYHVMYYDALLGGLVVAGGSRGSVPAEYFADRWLLTQSGWVQLQDLEGGARWAFGAVASPETGQVVLAGGATSRADTWVTTYAPVFVSQPSDQSLSSGDNLTLSVLSSGGNVTYQWFRGEQPLSNSARISGATSPTLTITRVETSDAGDYFCVATNRAGTATSRIASVEVLPCDSIDFNRNGAFPEDQDFVDFLDVLAGGTCAACNDIDFNNNGVFPEDQDVIDFFNVLAGGACP